jgi:hypothetical protein
MRRVLTLAGIVIGCLTHYVAGQSPASPPPSLTLDFPYPDGAFHDTFVYDSRSDSWTTHLDATDGAGGWKRFAEYRAVRDRGTSP